MNTETESQKEFDRLMNHGRKVGEMMADTVIASAPPPWEEEWFERLYTNATEQSGVAFRQAFPDITDVIVMNMQVRFQQGFEARMRDALPRLSMKGGSA